MSKKRTLTCCNTCTSLLVCAGTAAAVNAQLLGCNSGRLVADVLCIGKSCHLSTKERLRVGLGFGGFFCMCLLQ